MNLLKFQRLTFQIFILSNLHVVESFLLMKGFGNKSQYQFLEMIGSGASGTVYKALFIPMNLQVAIKVIDKKLQSNQYLNTFMEISLLKRTDHPLIAHIFDFFEDERKLYIVMEYIDNGSLLDYINEKHGLPLSEAQFFFKQLVEILDYLHNVRHIVHRDLKPENILIDKHKNLHLIDFGLSKSFTSNSSKFHTICGSLCYLAPEVIRGCEYDVSADIWSLGIIFYAMIFGKLPFYSANMHEEMELITTTKLQIPDYISQDIKHLLKGLLKKDPSKRLTIDQIKTHPMMQNINTFNELRNLSILKPSQSFFAEFLNFMKDKNIQLRSQDEIIKSIANNDLSNESLAYMILKTQYLSRTVKQMLLSPVICRRRPKSLLITPHKIFKYQRNEPSTKSLPINGAGDKSRIHLKNTEKKTTVVEFSSKNLRIPDNLLKFTKPMAKPTFI